MESVKINPNISLIILVIIGVMAFVFVSIFLSDFLLLLAYSLCISVCGFGIALCAVKKIIQKKGVEYLMSKI